MPPRAAARAASAKIAEKEATPTVNGTTSTSFASAHRIAANSPHLESSRTQRVASKPVNDVKEKVDSAPRKLDQRVVVVAAAASANHRRTAAKGRAKKEAAPKAAPKAAAKRKKAAEPESSAEEEAAEEPAAKRKKPDEDEATPEVNGDAPKPKKPKTAARASTPKRDLPKGPRRPKGKKIEINAVRYTAPLKVFVFGEGGQGELGLGATKKAIDVKRPRYNEALSNQDVVRVATGGMHVVALTKDNRILTWGVNDNGALGRDTAGGEQLKDMKDGDDSDSDSDDDETGGLNPLEATPTAISSDHFPEDTVFVDIAAGDSCSFALTTEGAVYGWGTFRKNEGILGFAKNNETATTPVYIDSLTKVTDLACGTNHVLALTKDHQVFAWGNGQQNQLGRRLTERNLNEALVPSRLGFHDSNFKRPSSKIARVACGDYHGLAIAEDGHIWSWGANNYCETGHGDNAGEDNASVITPRIIAALEGKNVHTVEGGSHHNLAITSSGAVLVWGRCDGSQTGIPASTLSSINDPEKVLCSENGKPKILIEPMEVPGLSDIVTGTCGPEHSIVISKQGKAYSWGFSANYQTGLGTDEDVEEPTVIENTAVREVEVVWAGAGGQYSVLASKR